MDLDSCLKKIINGFISFRTRSEAKKYGFTFPYSSLLDLIGSFISFNGKDALKRGFIRPGMKTFGRKNIKYILESNVPDLTEAILSRAEYFDQTVLFFSTTGDVSSIKESIRIHGRFNDVVNIGIGEVCSRGHTDLFKYMIENESEYNLCRYSWEWLLSKSYSGSFDIFKYCVGRVERRYISPFSARMDRVVPQILRYCLAHCLEYEFESFGRCRKYWEHKDTEEIKKVYSEFYLDGPN